MSFTSQEFESYLTISDVVPEKWEEAQPIIIEQFKKIANAVNVREIGWFIDEELLSGGQFIPGIQGGQNFRTILRKVVDFGPLPNTGTKSVAHGITFDSNFTLISLYASATDPIALVAIPIPFVSATGGDVEINMNTTNVNITTLSNRSAFTRCFVFVEYIQEL